MMPRSPLSQSLHDSVVLNRAKELQGEGNRVWADVAEYVTPQEVYGHIPDVLANGTQNLLSEIETAETYSSQHTKEQLKAFDSASNYRLEVVVPQSVYYAAKQLIEGWQISVDYWRTFKG
jgi:hypothetical protein